MSTTAHHFDWDTVKRRLRAGQMAIDGDWAPDDQRLDATYRQRMLDYANRADPATCRTSRRRILVARLGQERYGFDLAPLVTVFSTPKITPVPAAPPELLGLINVGGEIQTVFDTARLLGLPTPADCGVGHVLLLRHAQREVALRVDRVEAIENIDPETLLTPERNNPAEALQYIEGIAPARLIVLNVRRLLSHPVFAPEPIEPRGD
jgi:purine-binding chemotaxis protein CheW